MRNASKMKIIIIVSGNIPSKYAHSIQVMKMAQGFTQLGHEVELIAPLTLRSYLNKRKIGDIFSFYGIQTPFKVSLIPVPTPFTLVKRADLPSASAISGFLAKFKRADLVYCREYLAPYVTSKLGIPTITESHTAQLEKGGVRWLIKATINENFKKLVILSEALKEKWVEAGVPEEKIIICEDGVDLTRFDIPDDKGIYRRELNLPLDKPIVMYCGHLYKDKGIEHILLTAKLVGERAKFVLVGGWDKDVIKWENFCEENGIGNVIFTGFVFNVEVPKYLKAADVLIMPYKTDMEIKVMDISSTSPLKLFEYMASKRPIISTKIPTIEKVVKHQESVLLASENNVKELAQYVNLLIENPELGEKIANNAFREVQKYDWKRRCSKILENID